MEHSTSAVNWQPRNIAKRRGEMARNSLTHLGRGADGILFFQWRAGRSGAEKFHSAMLPHAGTDVAGVPRGRRARCRRSGASPSCRAARVQADVAILWDFESFWAQDLEWRPTEDLTHAAQVRRFYEQLWRDGITVDFALPGQDLSGYRLVRRPGAVPAEHGGCRQPRPRTSRDGGTLLVSFFSAIVDENDAVHEGGFVAPLRDALGLTVEEFLPLREGESHGTRLGRDHEGVVADVWQEDIALEGAEVVARFAGGPGAGRARDHPARARHGHRLVRRHPAGRCGHARTAARRLRRRGRRTRPASPEGLEVITRHGADAVYRIAVNHRDDDVELEATGIELLTGAELSGALTIAAGGVAVIRTIPLTARASHQPAQGRASSGPSTNPHTAAPHHRSR